jgi:hypothetical protein
MRAGKWSASKAAVIMGGLDTEGLKSYIEDIAWGRVYGKVDQRGYKSAAMERGNELEPETRAKYMLLTDRVITQCGLVDHSTLPNVCWSPDGLEGVRHGIEGKAPLHRAYMHTKKAGKIPSQYRWQTKFGMWVGELETMDYLSDHPSAPMLIIPAEVTDSEKAQMHERIGLLEPKVQAWVDILQDKRAA